MKTKKVKNYKKRKRVYTSLGILCNLIPLSVMVVLTTELAQRQDGSVIKMGIAGITVVAVNILWSMGKLKQLLGKRVFVLLVITVFLFMIRFIVDQMIIGLLACLVGSLGEEGFKRLADGCKEKLEEEKTSATSKKVLEDALSVYLKV